MCCRISHMIGFTELDYFKELVKVTCKTGSFLNWFCFSCTECSTWHQIKVKVGSKSLKSKVFGFDLCVYTPHGLKRSLLHLEGGRTIRAVRLQKLLTRFILDWLRDWWLAARCLYQQVLICSNKPCNLVQIIYVYMLFCVFQVNDLEICVSKWVWPVYIVKTTDSTSHLKDKSLHKKAGVYRFAVD